MDDSLRQQLTDLRELAAAMNPDSADDELGRARIEAYREGVWFAVSYLESEFPEAGDGNDIPSPRDNGDEE